MCVYVWRGGGVECIEGLRGSFSEDECDEGDLVQCDLRKRKMRFFSAQTRLKR